MSANDFFNFVLHFVSLENSDRSGKIITRISTLDFTDALCFRSMENYQRITRMGESGVS